MENNKIKDINEYRAKYKNNYKSREYKKERSKKEKNKKTIHKKRIRKRKVILLGVLALSSIIGYICGYSVVSKMKYDIGYLKKDLRKNEIVLEELKAKTYESDSVEKMEENAKEKLNMDYPKKNNIEYIDVDY